MFHVISSYVCVYIYIYIYIFIKYAIVKKYLFLFFLKKKKKVSDMDSSIPRHVIVMDNTTCNTRVLLRLSLEPLLSGC